jgi:hypothetical protein
VRRHKLLILSFLAGFSPRGICFSNFFSGSIPGVLYPVSPNLNLNPAL